MLQIVANLVTTFMNIMVDSGLIIVGFITTGYIILVFTLLVYVKYEWCDLLFKNNTENPDCRRQYSKDTFIKGSSMGSMGDKERNRNGRQKRKEGK